MSILFVEGAPGTGKSTTAQFLALHAGRGGRRATWIYEDEAAHPIFATPDTSSWDAYFTDSIDRWRAFAAKAGGPGDLTVIESALIQRPVFTLLRADVPPHTALAFLVRVAAVVRDAEPVLLYLSHVDPVAAFRALCARRGPEWVDGHVRRFESSAFAERRGVRGVDGLERYWSEHEALARRVVAELGMRTIQVRRAGDWTCERSHILSALSWPPADDGPKPDSTVPRFAGRYRDAQSRECTVDVDAGGLRVHGILWPANRLLPKAGNVFYAEAWPIEVVFEETAGGSVCAMRIVDNRVRSSRVHGVFEKVG